ncbi:unnamed protein product [Orchesella dallaii]|uniref:Protein kinase domain-containing protein n=1 Tax=Orchesella dallaii TaxID=48710 RepID=A0ABP1PXH8_9HEXA
MEARVSSSFDSSDSSSSSSMPNELTSDEICTTGRVIKNRYLVQKEIGKGSYGKVWKVTDKETGNSFAMKVLMGASQSLMPGVLSEDFVLEKIKSADKERTSRLIILESTFFIENQLTLLLPLYPLSLLDYMQKMEKGVEYIELKIISYQVLQALGFLAKLDLVHGDLKPENVMIVNESTLEIKVIDLGAAFKVSTPPSGKIQTRYYRAPEVFLQASFNNAMDMWSLGCIMFELRTKMLLFDCKSEMEQLRKMIEVLGMPPQSLILEGSRSETFFEGKIASNFKQRLNLKPTSQSLHKMLCGHHSEESGALGSFNDDLRLFIKLLGKMLNYDTKSRIKVGEAIKNSFFQSVKTELENGGVYYKAM